MWLQRSRALFLCKNFRRFGGLRSFRATTRRNNAGEVGLYASEGLTWVLI